MRFLWFIAAALTLAGTPVSGEPRGYAFDPATGTEFRWRMDADGIKHITGYNRAQGALWSFTIDPSGNRTGRDEDGDFWSFKPDSGVYRNTGKGLFCFLNEGNSLCLDP